MSDYDLWANPTYDHHAFPAGFALLGEVLSLACPRESTQRERHPEPASAKPIPCGPRRSGGAGNSADRRRSASDRMRAFMPERLRYSARATGPRLPLPPRRRSRASQGKPGQARPCLSASSDKRDRESGERRFCRDAQETRVSGQASGPPFFGVLFFGGAKKSTSPDRAKTDSRKRNQYLGSNRSEPVIRWIAMTMSDYGATHLI